MAHQCQGSSGWFNSLNFTSATTVHPVTGLGEECLCTTHTKRLSWDYLQPT